MQKSNDTQKVSDLTRISQATYSLPEDNIQIVRPQGDITCGALVKSRRSNHVDTLVETRNQNEFDQSRSMS